MLQHVLSVVAAVGAATGIGPLSGRLLLGAFAGLAAAVVMDIPMWRQEEGYTPAYVAASVLRRASPNEVSFIDANVVHHVAGALAGVLYALVHLAVDVVVPDVPIFGLDIFPHVVAVVVVVPSIYALFSYFVLPRAGRAIYEERATAVRGQWLRSALVFGVTLLVLGPALFAGIQ
ncbi:hypothetical protein [Haloferax larsenii]|uniref:Uncharacterized protein n=1 Tax=Haloferax larsenii TaxID=302484 RepID=A0A1H7UER3_HALLR|nr:hypothetical protein [Haloferax larsenii]UVE50306.1 hypothetical protein KU306_15620 [Haloferax larsenii]SEL95244.1 hypothetical protein SAMN04488691_11256 [Haloferax larsenii]